MKTCLNSVVFGFLIGSGVILAAMLFRAVLHAGFCS